MLTPFVCKTYARFNCSQSLRKLFKSQRIKEDEKLRMLKSPVSIFSTMFNCLSKDLINEFNSLKIEKYIVLFKDDKIIKFTKYRALLHLLKAKVILFEKGGHDETSVYWKNVAKLWK